MTLPAGTPLPVRFAHYVDRSGGEDACWPWTGYRDRDGYGLFKPTIAKTVRAHRFAWEQAHGPIGPELFICHRCDNPPCCNPAHLFVGTPAENNMDMHSKGRNRPAEGIPGSLNRNAKLTEVDALAIRASDASTKELAARYGVSKSAIQNIKNGKTWTRAAPPAGLRNDDLDPYLLRGIRRDELARLIDELRDLRSRRPEQ